MTKTAAEPTPEPITGLALLRQPFPAHQISKLPKETKAQIDERKADRKTAINCQVCGGWHHKHAIHLDYVGHAALTDRLLDVDPNWYWEPAALRDGLPAFDSTGGLWIKLTVCGVSRLGYGHAAPKPNMDPGAREKEVIGDALRNAAMRFGAALDLWHKGDLHVDDAAEEAPAAEKVPTPHTPPPAKAQQQNNKPLTLTERSEALMAALRKATLSADLEKTYARASGLMAELDDKDPERFAEVERVYRGMQDELETPVFA